MKYQLKTAAIQNIPCDFLIIASNNTKTLTGYAKEIDAQSGNHLSQSIKALPHLSKPGRFAVLQPVPGIKATGVVFLNVGKKATQDSLAKCLKKALINIKTFQPKNITLAIHDVELEEGKADRIIKRSAEVINTVFYCFDEHKTKKSPRLATIFVPSDKRMTNKLKLAFKQAIALANAMSFTKDLSNSPSNFCTPTYLAKQAKRMAKENTKFKTTIVDEAEMKKLGMGALLAVSQGSKEPAKLIVMMHQGAEKSKKPYVFVGKGVTFDTGGINAKGPDAMVGMKYDMCGAATVFGVMQAAAELKLPHNIIGIVSAVENMPDGAAYKPEDVITSMSGQTIEVLNTDAEGRLALCDALTYAERFKPKAVVDLATLTGAMLVSLGKVATGVFTNHQPLADDLVKAGMTSGDKAWQLPLFDEYQELIESPFADMQNIGGKLAGSITAACFLERFAKKYHWAHMDIAGTSSNWGGNRTSTARPLPLLLEYLFQK
jgi:leucyl aminopeptidase